VKSFLLGLMAGFTLTATLGKDTSVGGRVWARASFEEYQRAGRRIRERQLGGVVIGEDVSPELALAVIERLHVLGGRVAPKAVLDALGDRLKVTGGVAGR
jgi:Ribbon-Helix-Helix transcriptional regulator family